MKKSIAIFMALAIVLCLAGCGGGSKDPVQVGTWKMVSMVQGGVTVNATQLETLGVTGTLILTADKKASMDIAGIVSVTDGTWEAKGDTGVTITFEGESQDATIADGKLTIEQEGAKVVFEKEKASN